MAKVSIVTPVYNTGKYLERYFISILNQTYKDLDVIIVNNNSSDKLTLDIIDKYAKKDSRVRVFEEKRQGLSIAYNTGLDKVIGDYIVFVDSDDYLKKDSIETLVNEIGDYDLVQASYYLKYDHFTLLRAKPKRASLNKLEALKKLCKNTGVNNYVWAKIYKASLLKDIRFNETYNNFSDMEYTANVLLKADKIKTIPNRIYYYYQRKGSSTNGMSTKEARRMFECFRGQEDLLNSYYPNTFSMHTSYYRSELMLLLAYLSDDDKDVYLPKYDDSKIFFIFKAFRYILWQIVCLKKGLGFRKVIRR